MANTPTTAPATVYLVGAGPGDPDLITLRAVACLKRADVILYDYLVNASLLAHCAGDAELICLGHHSTGRALSPDEITDRMVKEARKGRTVVRLKGGDPSIFGRAADETEALRKAAIPYQIVPGITAGLAAAAYCEVPITHYDEASAVALVAGRERDCKAESHLDYAALAAFPGTIVFYMGVKRTAQWSRALIGHGKPPETPVAIIQWCSWPKQQMTRCTLGTVEQVVTEHTLRPPAVFIVGEVVDRAPETSWFAATTSFGLPVSSEPPVDMSKPPRDRLRPVHAVGTN